MSSCHIVDFSDENAITWIPLNLGLEKQPSGNYKKITKYNKNYGAMPLRGDFKTLDEETILKRQSFLNQCDYVATDTRSIFQIDVDFKDDLSIYDKSEIEYVEKLKRELPYCKSTTKENGYHFFIKTTFKAQNEKQELQVRKGQSCDIELLSGCWAFSKKEATIINSTANINKEHLLKPYLTKSMERDESNEETEEFKIENIEFIFDEFNNVESKPAIITLEEPRNEAVSEAVSDSDSGLESEESSIKTLKKQLKETIKKTNKEIHSTKAHLNTLQGELLDESLSASIINDINLNIKKAKLDVKMLSNELKKSNDELNSITRTENNSVAQQTSLSIQNDLEFIESLNEITEIVNNISTRFCDDYDKWMSIIWALKSIDKKELALQFSQRSAKFELKKFNDVWNTETSGNITKSTLYYYSKLSDEKKYLEIKSKFTVLKSLTLNTDDTLAELFLSSEKINYLIKDDELYTFNNGFWKQDVKNRNLNYYVGKILPQLLNQCVYYQNTIRHKFGYQILNQWLLKQQVRELETTSPENKKTIDTIERIIKDKVILKTYKECKNSSQIKSISSRIIDILSIKNNSIEFDNKPCLFAFKNLVYDLKTHKMREPQREDYLTMNNGLEFKKCNDEHKQTVNSMLEQIFPDLDIKKNYLHYLATGLYGYAVEKFIIANGKGGNGKGFLNELFCSLLGEDDNGYSYTAASHILLNPLKQGSNPEVANMNNKRFVICREPEDNNSFLCASTIKELTGGNKINARLNHSNNTKTNLKLTLIMECNGKPSMKEKAIDDALLRRFADIPFKASFMDSNKYAQQEKYAANMENVFLSNPEYKTDECKDNFKYALFYILVDYIKNFESEQKDKKNIKNVCMLIKDCEEVVKRTKDYLTSCDDVIDEFYSIYEKTESKNDYIKISEVLDNIKNSTYYTSLDKREQKKFRPREFTDYITRHISFSMFYRERLSVTIDAKQSKVRNVLCFHKKISVTEDI